MQEKRERKGERERGREGQRQKEEEGKRERDRKRKREEEREKEPTLQQRAVDFIGHLCSLMSHKIGWVCPFRTQSDGFIRKQMYVGHRGR
jgi:uncharacterized membrane protein